VGPKGFDIVVIGAGIAGASVAARLAPERRVVVLERESQPGYHSTGRSAALFSEIYGAEPVRALSRASREFLFSPPQGFAESALVRRMGALHIASPEQLAQLDAFARLPDIAPATHRLSGADAIALCPILRPDCVAGAVHEPDASDVDVHGLHQGFLRQLKDRGGQVETDRPVDSLSFADGRWIVEAGGMSFAAPIVVNAAGAWADAIADLAGIERIGLQPMRRTAMLVDPPPGVTVDGWPMVIDVDEGFYFKPDAGLLLLSPADETPLDPCDVQPDEWDIAVAVDRVQTATTLEVRRIKHKWAGLRSFVADRTPVAGFDPDAPGFFWLAGQGGYGIQTCPALSRLAADLVLERGLAPELAKHGVNLRDIAPERLRRKTSASVAAI
jgi:D-arginine dehydrogenase